MTRRTPGYRVPALYINGGIDAIAFAREGDPSEYDSDTQARRSP